jgi:predicted dinucleotide-binding enzyme
MKIGVIGIGDIGGTLARKLAEAGHDVRVANSKGPQGVRRFAEEIGAAAVDIRGAVADVDAVIVSIPLPAIAKLPKDLFDGVPPEVPVVDTGNYYPNMRDPRILELDEGQAESVWVAEPLGRPVIKAFNNILAHSLAELGGAEGSRERLAVAVAGDDAAQKRIVMGLVNEVGFDPVDAGPLAESWRQQPSTPGYCCDYDAHTMRKGLTMAVHGKAPARRDQLSKLLMSLERYPSHDELVTLNRGFNAVA